MSLFYHALLRSDELYCHFDQSGVAVAGATNAAADFRFVNFLTVDTVIGNQAFQNERCHICFSLGLDKVETGCNLLMELNALTKCLIVYIHTGLPAVSFYLMFGTNLSQIFGKVPFYN